MRPTRKILPSTPARARFARLGSIAAAGVAGLPLTYFLPGARGATDADWSAPVSGNWTMPSLWSTNPFFPRSILALTNTDVLQLCSRAEGRGR